MTDPVVAPLVLVDLLEFLGVSIQLIGAAVIALGAWWLLKGRRWGARLAGLAASGVTIGAAALIALAGAAAGGYLDVVGLWNALTGVGGALIDLIWGLVSGMVDDLLSGVLP